MKKAVYYQPRDLRIEEADMPEPGPGDVLVKVKYCGICGSDKHEYHHGLFPVSPFGHEIVGTVAALGAGVFDYEIGERVCCIYLGGFTEYLVVPTGFMFRIPEKLSWEQAVLLEPLSGAAYALKKGGIKRGNSLLVTGAGTVGLMVLLAARALEAGPVYMTDPSALKREKALRLGAGGVFDPMDEDVSKQIKEVTHGKGVDFSVEAVGLESSLKDCLASTKHGGTVVVQGIFTDRVPIHMLGFVTREITMIGANNIDVGAALEMVLKEEFPAAEFITARIPLEEIVISGFENGDPNSHIKILVEPAK